ncbi:assimilatory sulfite reductase (NADPH) flavoprotein subunit [uncultured Shewanella sp.]|uniref:assimilatory sulfite reductase (NADPH) flavoprotein subunit n=1 Tax=uncultured Shewanella sp. TaxID=173975 RepID=UPI002613371E|nr:assimilatory sulfite reductase (NADPH) flavoprotein subunit [uncultured Shewanella sp.]
MKKNLGPHLEKLWLLFAWSTLILAFIIGHIAAKPDYLTMAKAHYTNFNLVPSKDYTSLPVVFVPGENSQNTSEGEAVVIAAGTGYGGPFVLGVRAQKGENTARIKEVVVLSHKETPAYLQKLINNNFFRQFINKSVTDNFLIDDDVDGISGATVSSKGFTKAIAGALHKGAENHLGYEKSWKEVEWSPGLNEALMVGLFLMVLVVVYAPRHIAKPFKIILPFASLAFVGFYVNASISLGTLAGIVMGYVPEFRQYPIWWIIVGGVLAGIIFLGRNLYCGYLCPFSVIQDLLQKISGIKLALRPGMARNARRVIYGLSWFALILIFLSRHPALGSYEPFGMMFSLQGMGIQWYILPFSLLGSFFVPQFWCRLFCPVGLYLSEAVRLQHATVRTAGNILVKNVSSDPQSSFESYSKATDTLTILFASQTGNSKHLAYQLKANCDANGLPVRIQSMADYDIDNLQRESHLIIVTSTYGEGEPPESAEGFYHSLFSDDAPQLPNLSYSILALGDTGYRFFCQTGIDFDERLAELGAQRLHERAECDVDYEAMADAWITSVIKLLQNRLESSCANAVMPTESTGAEQAYYNKARPYPARLLANEALAADGCEKDFRHIALSLEGSGIRYQPGDLLSVWFKNDEAEVEALLSSLSIPADTEVEVDGAPVTIEQALIESYELTQCHPGFIEKYAALSQQAELAELAADFDKMRDYARRHQIFEMVRQYPARLTAEQLLSSLRRLTPRKYSISSSQSEVGEEVHLTIAVVEYQREHGTESHRYVGGASGYLGRRLAVEAEVKVFVEENEHFRLPEHDDASVIMIGPGTGVAPFRGFMQQRSAQKHRGKSWLFFGNRNEALDYLYRDEWQQYLERGSLSRMDLAFSRDQQQKIYVQHRIEQQGAEFYAWLEQGGYIYICGDVSHMAADVESAIMQVIETHGERSAEEAMEYFERLKREKRLLKDVY